MFSFVTRTRPPLSPDWRARRALSVPLWRYTELSSRLKPDPQSWAAPSWIAAPDVVASGKAARDYAERWISLVSPEGLPFAFAAVQAVGEARLSERVAVAWLMREGLGLTESTRELLSVIGSDWPEEVSSWELVDGAAVILWWRWQQVGDERRGELVDTFRSWAGFASAAAEAWAEWEAVYPNGRGGVVGGAS